MKGETLRKHFGSKKKPRKFYRMMRQLKRQSQRDFEIQFQGHSKIKAKKRIEFVR